MHFSVLYKIVSLYKCIYRWKKIYNRYKIYTDKKMNLILYEGIKRTMTMRLLQNRIV